MCMRGACSWCDLSGLKKKLDRDLKMDHSKLIKTFGSGRIYGGTPQPTMPILTRN